MTARQDRLTALRAVAAERAEREAALPRAICRTCGGWAHAGAGTMREPSAWEGPRERQEREELERRLPEEVAGWRRTCGTCARVKGDHLGEYVLRALLGVQTSTAEGNRVLRDLLEWNPRAVAFDSAVPIASECERWTGRPWGHVSGAERGALRSRVLGLLVNYRAEALPRPSTQGACGLCGIRDAVSWHATSLIWPDGSPAPMCGNCDEVNLRRGEPTDAAGIRRVAAEAATGRPIPLGEEAPEGFRAFYEHRTANPEGHAEPWAYSDRLTAYRDRVWENSPEYAPAEHRNEYTQRRAVRQAEADAVARRARDALAW
jgi:hypothetical protein